MKQANYKNFFLILSIVLIIGSFLIFDYTAYRLFSLLLGSIFFLIYNFSLAKKLVFKFITVVVFLALIFSVDLLLSYYKLHEPIFALEVKSSAKIKVYNGLFYRVYSCNNKLTFDALYQKEYQCQSNDLTTMDINSFLNNIENNYEEYNNKFIKVTGKVSQVNGSNIIEMAPYEITEDSINGHVSFGNNLTLKIYFNKNLTKIYKIYDNVTVIGRISKIKKNKENYALEMTDSIIKDTDLYNDFSILVNTNQTCENITNYAKVDDINIKNYCLQNIYIKYDAANVYELSYVLLDKKLSIKELLGKCNSEVEGYNKLYEFETFNILQCKENNDMIIGPKTLDVDSNFCPKDNLINPNEVKTEE